MKSTANLGLNLYEATDYVLHDSFNSDNQKLDAAVMAAHSFHKLKELSVSTAGRSVSFDLGGIDWSRWQAVHLDFLALVDGTSDTSFDLYFNADATTLNVYWRLGMSYGDGCTMGKVLANAGEDRVWADRITMPVGKCPERLIRAVTSDGCGRHELLRYSQLTTLHLQAPTASSLNVLAGTKLVLWGED